MRVGGYYPRGWEGTTRAGGRGVAPLRVGGVSVFRRDAVGDLSDAVRKNAEVEHVADRLAFDRDIPQFSLYEPGRLQSEDCFLYVALAQAELLGQVVVALLQDVAVELAGADSRKHGAVFQDFGAPVPVDDLGQDHAGHGVGLPAPLLVRGILQPVIPLGRRHVAPPRHLVDRFGLRRHRADFGVLGAHFDTSVWPAFGRLRLAFFAAAARSSFLRSRRSSRRSCMASGEK